MDVPVKCRICASFLVPDSANNSFADIPCKSSTVCTSIKFFGRPASEGGLALRSALALACTGSACCSTVVVLKPRPTVPLLHVFVALPRVLDDVLASWRRSRTDAMADDDSVELAAQDVDEELLDE